MLSPNVIVSQILLRRGRHLKSIVVQETVVYVSMQGILGCTGREGAIARGANVSLPDFRVLVRVPLTHYNFNNQNLTWQFVLLEN